MIYGGNEIVCGLVTADSGEKEIVSMGNRAGQVEIYNIASNVWREGRHSLSSILGRMDRKLIHLLGEKLKMTPF